MRDLCCCPHSVLFLCVPCHVPCVIFDLCASPHGVPAGYVCGLLCDVMFLATTVDTCYVVSTVCVGHCIAPSYAVCGMWAVFSSTCRALRSVRRFSVSCAVAWWTGARRTKNARSRPRRPLAARHCELLIMYLCFPGVAEPRRSHHCTGPTDKVAPARAFYTYRALSDWTSHASQ